jgi:hypothetical protein
MTDMTSLTPSVRELPLEPGGEVSILLTANDIHVRAVDSDRVTVRTATGADIDDEVELESSPGHVLVRDADRGFRLGPVRIRGVGAASLEIDVPRTARLSVKTASGDVEADGLEADSRVATASGDIRIGTGGGTLNADSMSGDVVIEATAAISVRARSVSGDVTVRAPQLDALQLSTTSGDVAITGMLAPGAEHTVTSVSGDVLVRTPSPVRLETQTIAGDLRVQGMHRAEGGRGRRVAVVGDGSVRLGVRTTSGDIRLAVEDAASSPASQRAPAPMAPPAPEPPVAPEPPLAPAPPVDRSWVVAEADAAPNLVRPAAPADAEPAWTGAESATDRREAARLEILRALERGELDIEAASYRLEQLDEAGPRSFRGFC